MFSIFFSILTSDSCGHEVIWTTSTVGGSMDLSSRELTEGSCTVQFNPYRIKDSWFQNDQFDWLYQYCEKYDVDGIKVCVTLHVWVIKINEMERKKDPISPTQNCKKNCRPNLGLLDFQGLNWTRWKCLCIHSYNVELELLWNHPMQCYKTISEHMYCK